MIRHPGYLSGGLYLVGLYHGDWDFTVEDGLFHHEDGGSAVVFAPVKVLAFAKGLFAQTRYRF